MKACWSEKDAEYHGEYVDFDPVWVEPKPNPFPIYMGAESKWAMDRVAEYAHGWLPTITPEMKGMISQLEAACEARAPLRLLQCSIVGGSVHAPGRGGVPVEGLDAVVRDEPDRRTGLTRIELEESDRPVLQLVLVGIGR